MYAGIRVGGGVGCHMGGGKGVKRGKIRFQWRLSKKIRKMKNIYLVVRNTSNLTSHAKKFELFGD